MSVDQDCSPEIAAMIGTSAALAISDVPFNGPIGGVIVGRVDGQFVINPTTEQAEKSDIHLVVAGTKDAIMMVEAEARMKFLRKLCLKRLCLVMMKSRRSLLSIEELVQQLLANRRWKLSFMRLMPK